MSPLNGPDFERARQYAFSRLERELSPRLHYHNIHHTRDDVVPAATRLAEMENISGEPRLLLLTAACFHDLGFIERRAGHETVSAAIAEEALPQFGYSPAQMGVITGIILATRVPQSPTTHLEQIMADADLDSLGREDFMQTIAQLRKEWSEFAPPPSDAEWYTRELNFLTRHQYFTVAARRLREDQKQRNIALLARLLAECQDK